METIKERYSVRSKNTGKVHTVRVDTDIALYYATLTGYSRIRVNAILKDLAQSAVVEYEGQDTENGTLPVNWFMKSSMLRALVQAANYL